MFDHSSQPEYHTTDYPVGKPFNELILISHLGIVTRMEYESANQTALPT
jgi:hypothetical protein